MRFQPQLDQPLQLWEVFVELAAQLFVPPGALVPTARLVAFRQDVRMFQPAVPLKVLNPSNKESHFGHVDVGEFCEKAVHPFVAAATTWSSVAAPGMHR